MLNMRDRKTIREMITPRSDGQVGGSEIEFSYAE
jgi:hypothetical protein